jgi:hypothetical protein
MLIALEIAGLVLSALGGVWWTIRALLLFDLWRRMKDETDMPQEPGKPKITTFLMASAEFQTRSGWGKSINVTYSPDALIGNTAMALGCLALTTWLGQRLLS